MKFALTLAALLISKTAALPAITRTGKYLYDPDGTRFFIKGIAYQEAGTLAPPPEDDPNHFPEPLDYTDPLAIPEACERDIPNLQRLTVNAIRVYSVDASLDHSACMNALDAAGIYVMIDLSLPVNGSITREDPAWTSNLLNLYLGTIDEFLQYDNVLAFNVGNEVVNDAESTIAGPFIKAAARDVKAYLRSKNSNALVGFASTDGAGWRDPLAHYLTCESDDVSIDIYGLNNYRWCGAGSVEESYGESLTAFADLPVAAYLSEYGCISERPRTWSEVEGIYSEEMAEVYSGGVAFSYFPTNDGYGVTELDGDTVTLLEEFDVLETALSAITSFPTEPSQDASEQPSFSVCPAQSDDWLPGNALPPTPNQSECDCIMSVSPCAFSPQTDNHAALFEPLFADACTLLGQNGGSCDPIAADGVTGTYGALSFCDPAAKISWVFSQFYLATDNNAQSCNFAGNATVNPAAPDTVSEVDDGVESCLAADPDVFTPTEPTFTPGSAASTTGPGRDGSTTGTGGGSDGGAVSLVVSSNALAGVVAFVLCALGAGSIML